MRNFVVTLFLAALCFSTFAQIRYVDIEPKIVHPEPGYYYISPGEDSVVYYLINNGPDTLKASDRYATRWRLANVWFNHRFGPLQQEVLPGDSVLLKHVFPLDYYNHRPEVKFCVESYVYNHWDIEIFNEPDSAAMWENNLVCTRAAHNRVTNNTKELVSAKKISVYPNPTKNTLTVKNVKPKDKLTWYTLSGQQLAPNFTEDAERRSYDIGYLDSGIYLITLPNGRVAKVIKY